MGLNSSSSSSSSSSSRQRSRYLFILKDDSDIAFTNRMKSAMCQLRPVTFIVFDVPSSCKLWRKEEKERGGNSVSDIIHQKLYMFDQIKENDMGEKCVMYG